ncbi:MAG: hypothetical protein QM296_09090 [Bacillota bacterium]|nr:hypothetical protein [Bacillota bacterium]
MNLIEFYDRVQTLSESLSHEVLQDLVRRLATEVAEDQREAFLKRLEEAPKSRQAVRLPDVAAAIRRRLERKVRDLQPKLETIAGGERSLDGKVNWKATDWRGDDMVYVFRDKNSVRKDINTALSLMRECLDMALYDLGYLLAGQILDIQVQVTGEYQEYDGEPLTLSDLDSHKLLGRPYLEVISECLYFTYMTSEMSERPSRVYELIQKLDAGWPELDDVRRLGGGELPGFTEFLPLWLRYLASQDEDLADQLLAEALGLEKDWDFLLTLTQDFGRQHPRLYVELLGRLRGAGEWEEMLALGREALDRLPLDYQIRSTIARIAANAAWKLDQVDQAEDFLFEAFRSDSSVVNYLRLRFSCRDWSSFADRIRAVYESVWRAKRDPDQGIRVSRTGVFIRRNQIGGKTYLALLMLDKSFAEAWDLARKDSPAKLFYYDALNDLIPLLLLLFYQDSIPDQGLVKMLDRTVKFIGFGAIAYNSGAAVALQGSDAEALWSLILKWRSEVGITEAERDKWLAVVEADISSKVDEILSTQDRAGYAWAADLLAALGEVRESCGHEGRKSELLGHFRKKYPRLSSFKKEVSRYGGL